MKPRLFSALVPRRPCPLVKGGMLCLALTLLLAPPHAASDDFKEREVFLMGTFVRVSLCRSAPSEVFEAAFARVREIDDALSTYKPESELSRLNRRQTSLSSVNVSPLTADMIRLSQRYFMLSKGAFDPSVQPFIELWGFETKHPHVPSRQRLRLAKPRVGLDKLHLDAANTLVLPVGAKLNFGAVAKGYAADLAYEALQKRGISCGTVDAGRTLRFWGKAVWDVAVQDPRKKPGTPFAWLRVGDGALSGSGQYEKYFEDKGRRYGHVLNPRNGRPAPLRKRGLVGVTVYAPTAAEADALSTACFVMGEAKARRMLRKLKGVEAVFLKPCSCGTLRFSTTRGLRGKLWSAAP